MAIVLLNTNDPVENIEIIFLSLMKIFEVVKNILKPNL